MLSEYESVFNSTAKLITTFWNWLKEDINETCECLNAWYKQDSMS